MTKSGKKRNSQAFFPKTYERRVISLFPALHTKDFRVLWVSAHYARVRCWEIEKNNPPIPLIPHVRFFTFSVG